MKIKLTTIVDVEDFVQLNTAFLGSVDVKCGSLSFCGEDYISLLNLGRDNMLDITAIHEDEFWVHTYYMALKDRFLHV